MKSFDSVMESFDFVIENFDFVMEKFDSRFCFFTFSFFQSLVVPYEIYGWEILEFRVFHVFHFPNCCPHSTYDVYTQQKMRDSASGAVRMTLDEFGIHSVPRCLDSQEEKLQGVGLSGDSLSQLSIFLFYIFLAFHVFLNHRFFIMKYLVARS